MAKSNKHVYLDYSSGVLPNPSSIHEEGLKAKIKLQNARKEVAITLKALEEEIIFTSGGTESNNLAIQGTVLKVWELGSQWGAELPSKPHIITTNIEHPSVLETFKIIQRRKLAEISIVPVEGNGIVDPKKIKREMKENTILVSVMYVNNEIGTIQPIREIAKEIRYFNKNKKRKLSIVWNRPCLFHTDAVQAAKYLDLNVERLGVDLLSLSGSKIEGAGRVGLLYKKKTASISPIFGGGEQENGFRAGTENLTEIIKFSKALKLAQGGKEKENKRLKKLQNYFVKKLYRFYPIINGDLENRLPNNINITFPKIPSDLLVIELSAKGVMASSKSACESSHKEGSYVIKAIRSRGLSSGVNAEDKSREIGGLRFSMGSDTTKRDIDYTLKVLSKILLKLKKWYY